jgi:hypothetical protein
MSPAPMPPIEFQTLVCGPGSESLFGEVGCWLRDALHQQDMLGPNANVLDVGCGCDGYVRAPGHNNRLTHRFRPPSTR